MNALRDMLNEFYYNISEWLRQPVIDAINAAEENEEDHVITPLSQLIVLLDRGQDNEAVNLYMTNPVTRHSATRRFFFPHTLPENLYPEDVHSPPPPPTASLTLARAPALPLFEDMVPPPNPLALSLAMTTVPMETVPPLWQSFLLPASAAYAAPSDDPFEQLRLLPSAAISSSDFRPSLAPALRMNAMLARDPPRIDSFFQPGVSHSIAAMASQVPDPEQAQVPSVIRGAPRTLQNDLPEEDIYE